MFVTLMDIITPHVSSMFEQLVWKSIEDRRKTFRYADYDV